MANRVTLNVSLTPQLLYSVRNRVAVGQFGSASEVVRAALDVLESASPSGQSQPPEPQPGCPRAAADDAPRRA